MMYQYHRGLKVTVKEHQITTMFEMISALYELKVTVKEHQITTGRNHFSAVPN